MRLLLLDTLNKQHHWRIKEGMTCGMCLKIILPERDFLFSSILNTTSMGRKKTSCYDGLTF